MSQTTKTSMIVLYVQKDGKILTGFNLVQKLFIYNNLFQCYARLKVIDSENANAEKQCSKTSLKSKLTPRLPPLIIIK